MDPQIVRSSAFGVQSKIVTSMDFIRRLSLRALTPMKQFHVIALLAEALFNFLLRSSSFVNGLSFTPNSELITPNFLVDFRPVLTRMHGDFERNGELDDGLHLVLDHGKGPWQFVFRHLKD